MAHKKVTAHVKAGGATKGSKAAETTAKEAVKPAPKKKERRANPFNLGTPDGRERATIHAHRALFSAPAGGCDFYEFEVSEAYHALTEAERTELWLAQSGVFAGLDGTMVSGSGDDEDNYDGESPVVFFVATGLEAESIRSCSRP